MIPVRTSRAETVARRALRMTMPAAKLQSQSAATPWESAKTLQLNAAKRLRERFFGGRMRERIELRANRCDQGKHCIT
jgi:hypothetical protein